MVSILYDATGCLCNPGVNLNRTNHVCLPLRQLSMQHMRMTGQILFPHQPTDEELAEIFSMNLDRQHRFHLEKTLTGGTISDLWTSSIIRTILRETCVLCGMKMHPADLVLHLHEAHQCGQPIVQFLKSQLISKFVDCNADDFKCTACGQVYNSPCSDATELDDATRHTATQAHFRAQCPCVLQCAIILGKAAHGRHGNARTRRGESASLGSIPGNSAADRPDAEAGTEQRCAQAAKKRRTAYPTRRPGQAAASQGQGRSGTRPDVAGQTDPQIGQGSSAAESRGHLPLLFWAQRSKQQPPVPHDSNGDVGEELPGLNEAAASAATTTALGSGALQHTADQNHAVGRDEVGIRDSTSSHTQPDPSPGWHMPLPGMGPSAERTEGQPEEASDLETLASALHGHDRAPGGCEPGGQFPCTTLQQQGDHSLETTGEPEGRSAVADTPNPDPFRGVAAHGDLDEGTRTETEPSCPEPTAGLGNDETIQGQRQRQDQDACPSRNE